MQFYVKIAHAAKRTPNYVELNMIFRKLMLRQNRFPLIHQRKYLHL